VCDNNVSTLLKIASVTIITATITTTAATPTTTTAIWIILRLGK